MDFLITLSDEMEVFRQEVSRWLDDNPPQFSAAQAYSEDEDEEGLEWGRRVDFRGRLGARGWLYPTFPSEYGGGGLTPDHALVIAQELERRNIPNLRDLGEYAAAC